MWKLSPKKYLIIQAAKGNLLNVFSMKLMADLFQLIIFITL